MADIKRRSLILLNGKEVKLFGNSLAINKSLQIGEGGAANILSFTEQEPEKQKPSPLSGGNPDAADQQKKGRKTVFNPHNLTVDELYEIADFHIRLWVEFKDSLRRNGVTTKLFNSDANG